MDTAGHEHSFECNCPAGDDGLAICRDCGRIAPIGEFDARSHKERFSGRFFRIKVTSYYCKGGCRLPASDK